MVAAANASGALLTVDHNRLFDPPILEARRLLESGALGEIVAIESYQAGLASERSWLGDLPGGNLGDLIPHPLYLQLAFLGPVRELEAQCFGHASAGASEELRVLMRGDSASGMLTISTNARPHLNTLKLCGTKMTVEANLNNMTIVRRREYDVPKVIGKPLPNLHEAAQLVTQTLSNTIAFVRGKVRYYPGMGTLIERFYDAVRSGGVAPVSGEAGAEVVRVTSWIWDSLGRGAGEPTRRLEV
jgi:predicted dehydrogenase